MEVDIRGSAGGVGAGGTQPCEAPTERLSDIAGHLNVLHAELVDVTVELLANDGWREGGATTPSAFLQRRLGLSPSRADDVVRVAARAGSFPVLTGAFRRGELSLEQVAAAVEAPPWADELIVDFVRISTVAKIRRAMRSNMFTPDPDEAVPDAAPPRDRLTFGAVRGGRWRITGELGLDDGRRIEAALTERRDALFAAGDETVTWAEAFTECMERSLDAVESSSRRDRFRTWLHLDAAGDATTTDGWRIPMAVRDRILCDGVVQPVWHRDGVPFSVGRAQHIVPERTRRIVELRDRGCRMPGCTRDRFVKVHHVVHWNEGGPTDTWNLVSLCPRHHKLHHRGHLGISGDADVFDGLVFTDGDGRPLSGTGPPPPPPAGPPPSPDVPYRAPLAGRFDWNWIGLGWVHPNARRQRIERARQLAGQQRRAGGTHRAA